MTADAWLTLGVLVVLFALLVWDGWPTWVVFGGALTAILTLGLASEADALQGFANTGVLTVVVLYIVAAGMYRTGAISMLITRIIGQPKSETEANAKLLPLTAVGSAFLNNTPIVAMLVPVIADLGRSARLTVSKLYMAVSDASILGGSTTLIGTSTNLIIAGLVLATFDEDLGVFFPTRIGLPGAIVGLAFLLFVAPRLLRQREEPVGEEAPRRRYRAEFFLPKGSQLAGRTLLETGLSQPTGAELLSVRDGAGDERGVEPELELAEGDVLTFSADIEAIPGFWSMIGLLAANPRKETGREYAHRLVEVVVANDAPFIGTEVAELRLGEYHEKVVAVSRSGAPVTTPIVDTTVASGDNLVIEVREEFLDDHHEQEFALERPLRGYRIQRVGRAVAAGIIVVGMVLLSAFGIMSLLNAALLATAALLITGCITFRRAWRSIDWQTYVVLAAAVGLEPAITGSGLADVIADGLNELAGGNTFVALVVVYLGAVLLTNLVTNAAAAAIMFPITVGVVAGLGVAWQPYIAVLMMGTSYAFINPAAYQTHLMVYEPGEYQFMDFVKVGTPLTILLGFVVVPLAALLYPM
jgi:di/tricarboxylate transporter